MRVFEELFSVGSRLVNVLTGGSADLTFSARVWIKGYRIRPLIDFIFRPWGRDHCKWAWEQDVARAREVLRMNGE